MADIGLCKGCKNKNINRITVCRYCGDKFCTACTTKNAKCPTCGKGAWKAPNR